MSLIYDIFIELFGSYLYDHAKTAFRSLRGILPATLAGHRADVRVKLASMPFIYKDLPMEVLTGFADVEIHALDKRTLAVRPLDSQASFQRIRDHRKVLFLGNAGVGKTTFFRHAALTVSGKEATSPYFYPEEALVAFYVPLKAVQNVAASPIVNYLLRSYRYLAGGAGAETLSRLVVALQAHWQGALH